MSAEIKDFWGEGGGGQEALDLDSTFPGSAGEKCSVCQALTEAVSSRDAGLQIQQKIEQRGRERRRGGTEPQSPPPPLRKGGWREKKKRGNGGDS